MSATDESVGGDLAVIPGAHLFRDPLLEPYGRSLHDDDAMRAGWMKGRRHPLTGEPLEIVRCALPPGSLVSFVPHAPHCVAARKPGAPMRWSILLSYVKPYPAGVVAAGVRRQVPDAWTREKLRSAAESGEGWGRPEAREIFSLQQEDD
eukprot:COSAG04_NODE_831_length_10013_cov_78.138894_12_plen_149_part_00